MNYYIPQWEERTSYGIRRIDPYAKLFEDRIIFLGTPISDDIANAVMAQLLCLESMDPSRDIQIYINSPGGSFTAMTAIYDTMNFIQPDVQTVCLGQAASAAAILLAAGAPGKRLALPNSRILIHQPYTEGTYGQSSDIEIQANEILRMRELLEKMIADHSGRSIEEVSRDIERDNPEFRRVDETRNFLQKIYDRPIEEDAIVTVVHFSQIVEPGLTGYGTVPSPN